MYVTMSRIDVHARDERRGGGGARMRACLIPRDIEPPLVFRAVAQR